MVGGFCNSEKDGNRTKEKNNVLSFGTSRFSDCNLVKSKLPRNNILNEFIFMRINVFMWCRNNRRKQTDFMEGTDRFLCFDLAASAE